MMAATVPGIDIQAENRQLRVEVEQLKKDLEELSDHSGRQILAVRKELKESQDFFAKQIMEFKRELSQIKKRELMESDVIPKHVDEIIDWLDAHPERKGMNNKEAAKAMNVTRARVSQIKPKLALDKRLKISRKHISFA